MARRRRPTNHLAIWANDPHYLAIASYWEPRQSWRTYGKRIWPPTPQVNHVRHATIREIMLWLNRLESTTIWEEIMDELSRITCPTTLDDILQKIKDEGLKGFEFEILDYAI